MPIPIETVQTETFAMDYFRFGSGERTLVVLPGLSVRSVMRDADGIADAYRSLADIFTVYVFDRRKDLPPVYPIREMARDTAAAMRSLGLRGVCLFGASQGGMIAQALAIENPELVSRLALGSTSARMREEEFRALENWIELARRGDRENLYLAFGRAIYPPAVFERCRERLRAASAEVTDADLARFIILAGGTRDFNVADELSAITCPVFAIGAFEDSVLDSDATMEIAQELDFREGFRLYMYTGFGHAAFDTAPDYRERLLKFFTE